MKSFICIRLVLICSQVGAFQIAKVQFTSKGVGIRSPRNLAPMPACSSQAKIRAPNEHIPAESSTSLGFFGRQRSHLMDHQEPRVKGAAKARFRRLRKWTRRALATAALFLMVSLSSSSPAWARTGGRMGGSFKRSSSSYSTRSAPRSRPSLPSAPIRMYNRPSPRMIMHHRPRNHVYAAPLIDMEAPIVARAFDAPRRRPRRRVGMSDVVLVTGAGTWITLSVMNHSRNNGGGPSSPLGSGVSVISLTVSLNVPDRDSPNSILSTLSRQAFFARTDTRKGVQDMIADASLTLLRQERAIVSAESVYKHFSNDLQAERAFNSISVAKRSKFDRETINNYGGKKSPPSSSNEDGSLRATTAVVSITLCIEGDSTKIPEIRNRRQLREALSRIASDAQIDDCLLSAEVLWTPEERSESLSSKDIYADYPSLYPLLD